MPETKIAVNGMLLRHPYTGVEYSILNLVRALAEWGSESYDAYVPADFADETPAGGAVSLVRGRVPTPLRAARIFWEQVILPTQIAKSGAACLHAPGYIAPLNCRIPVVLTIYDVIALLHPEWCKPLNQLHYRRFLPASARMAARIVVPSETTRQDVRERLDIPDEKIQTIPLGIDARYLVITDADEKERARQRLDLPSAFILFVGQLEPKKNLVGLLDAFRLLKTESSLPHHLVIAGTRGWKVAELEHRIREYKLEKEVRLLGYAAEEDLPVLYNLADVFVFPSLVETFGNPLVEAMASGAPIVSAGCAAMPEILGEAALLVDPRDPDAIGRAIARVLDDAPLGRRLGARALERASRFSWEETALRTADVLKECARGDRGG